MGNNYLHCFLPDVITYPCINFNFGFTNPPLMLWHLEVITSHRFYVDVITYPNYNPNADLANIYDKMGPWHIKQ